MTVQLRYNQTSEYYAVRAPTDTPLFVDMQIINYYFRPINLKSILSTNVKFD